MTVRYYMDVHIPRAVTVALRLRSMDVLTAQEGRAADWDDTRLLLRAASLGRVFVSQDDDLLREAARLQREGTDFNGVIYAHQLMVSIGQFVEDLALIEEVTDSSEWTNRVLYLPL